MKSRCVVIGMFLVGVTLSPIGAMGGGSGESGRDRAAAAVASFAGELQQALTGAMSSFGPLAAIEVCNVKAPAIAARVSEQSGVRVSRTSERTRNARNAASGWQAEVLRAWAAEIAAGADPKALEHFEEIADGGFRYMKPIMVQPICLTCHGASPQPEIEMALGDLYPGDRATGYSAGDLRGAFVAQN